MLTIAEIAEFHINEIAPGIYSFLDDGEDSFYLVTGDRISAVIDTGVSPGKKIRPVMEKLTDKPLVLVLTHAHVDHFYHMDEFNTVYMCHDELAMSQDVLDYMMAGKNLDLEGTLDIRTGDIIDLGGEQLEICQVPGHTPGSVVILAKQHNLLFTGDAIGSGYGVWMQVPGAIPLAEYYSGLCFMQRWLVERGARMKFYGGHNMQQFQSSYITHYNPLGMGLLGDLIDLVDKVVKGEIIGRDSNADKVLTLEPTKYACYGRAELQFLDSRIR